MVTDEENVAPLWPLADEVARAIVTACAIEGDDPILVAQGGFAPRSRVYAFLALAAARKQNAAKEDEENG